MAGLKPRGKPIEARVVMSFWLYGLGVLVVIVSLLKRADHHHGAGIGFLSITAAWLAILIIHAYLDHNTPVKLHDISPRATTFWVFAVFFCPAIVFVLACIAGYPGGIALVPAAVVFFAALFLECIMAYGLVQKELEEQRQEVAIETTDAEP